MTITNMNKAAYESIMNNAQKSTTGRRNAVISPSMIFADEMYQRVEKRNEDKLNRLRKEWDYNLMDALLVVPHPETYNFFVVDGLGRLTVAKELGLSSIDCVIIDGPEDPSERRIFEARYFLRQAICTDPLRPVAMHKARVLISDPTATAIENICREYGVGIITSKGNRGIKVLGSYDRTFKLVKRNGEDVLRWVFEVIKYAGYDNEKNGYSGRLMTVLGKLYDGYNDISAKSLGEYLRGMSPMILQANAVSAYPKRAHNPEIPMILYLQDWVLKNTNKEIVFDLNGKKMKIVAA
jgi:hypothetical protein